tara:strand:+ start:1459 stop:1740 length:282 start_codon:yes stop_codon:yes gene_type:complete
MNERINQLLKQARTDCSQLGSKPATTVGYDELERFAELVRADEREACAKVCEDIADRIMGDNVTGSDGAGYCANEIRARGNRTKTSKDICDND